MKQMRAFQTKKTSFAIFTLTLFLVSMVLSVVSVLVVTPKFELRVTVNASMGGIIKVWSDWFEEPTSLDVNNQFNSYQKKMAFKHFT